MPYNGVTGGDQWAPNPAEATAAATSIAKYPEPDVPAGITLAQYLAAHSVILVDVESAGQDTIFTMSDGARLRTACGISVKGKLTMPAVVDTPPVGRVRQWQGQNKRYYFVEYIGQVRTPLAFVYRKLQGNKGWSYRFLDGNHPYNPGLHDGYGEAMAATEQAILARGY